MKSESLIDDEEDKTMFTERVLKKDSCKNCLKINEYQTYSCYPESMHKSSESQAK